MPKDIFHDLKVQALKFTKNRNWLKYHTPKNLSMAISVESAELLEIFQWVSNKESLEQANDIKIMEDIKGEVADIIIYILHLANILNINLEQAVRRKLELNEKRFSNNIVSQLENGKFRK